MGLLVVFMTYIVVAMVMFFVGPCLFWFAAKKFGKFENNTLGKHGIFWLAWFAINAAIQFILSLLYGQLPELSNLINSSLLLFLAIHVGLSMLIFKAQLVPAIKATVAYYVLFVICFLVVSAITVQLSFNELIQGVG